MKRVSGKERRWGEEGKEEGRRRRRRGGKGRDDDGFVGEKALCREKNSLVSRFDFVYWFWLVVST